MDDWINDGINYCGDCDITFKVYGKNEEVTTGFCPQCGTRKIDNVEPEEDEFCKDDNFTLRFKTYLIVYYNRFANETQTVKIVQKNAFRAGREFYRNHNRKAYHACIEQIVEL
ncbi:hypothetical protein PQE70_gp080 [Bacillus phage vB_BanS_Nate]|uniref:Uncharacterized protein n=1 Tax=Bacillus phage vB_BanS_Nate TaxID=2894788 RepID=A0AAE8YUC4_9CAUD|nr:hypothetical protein PQE70_gp080 [Bacillus phage vB_BanS_Nate]UGO50933.1 hypothetical protein NATE_80 [Bacillus phage vB_BanS_Nate]